ncbi:phage portal family protein [Paenirhodobacter populi]|uniref:Phage portal protein n=1 Tax=Paenirhodobacter populi TaxID=2306993 RepID=A0A443J1K4_9RHOB|nr:phage portal protein [Sinirhodobacter populi]RWR14310.1 phage portal protein [Sinirhodobacter populi]
MFGWFKRQAVPQVETRSASSTGYTAQILAARQSYISGVSGLGELTAAVQSSVSLWESGLSLADVKGTDLLSRRMLALTARSLALRGESIWLIRDRLVPCSDWDLTTRDGEPRAYRVSIPEAGGARSDTVLAGEVLHFRIGSDVVAPWTGTAPLQRARLSADLLEQLETALRDVFRDAPIGSQIVPVPEGSAEDMASLRAGFRGKRGAALVIEGVAQAVGAGMHPQLGKGPDQLSPDLSDTLADKMLTEAKGAIYGTFGILPGLFNPATTGPLVREAQRHLAQIVLQPIANIMAEEATEKLGAGVQVDVVRPMQAFDAGGKARALATMIGALAQAKEAGIDGPTLQDALSFIDWQDE